LFGASFVSLFGRFCKTGPAARRCQNRAARKSLSCFSVRKEKREFCFVFRLSVHKKKVRKYSCQCLANFQGFFLFVKKKGKQNSKIEKKKKKKSETFGSSRCCDERGLSSSSLRCRNHRFRKERSCDSGVFSAQLLQLGSQHSGFSRSCLIFSFLFFLLLFFFFIRVSSLLKVGRRFDRGKTDGAGKETEMDDLLGMFGSAFCTTVEKIAENALWFA
jgi:hypothetical protein